MSFAVPSDLDVRLAAAHTRLSLWLAHARCCKPSRPLEVVLTENTHDRSELPPRSACIGLTELREYMDTVRPSLRLSEPDSYAWEHYRETGHVFAKGCCLLSHRDEEHGRVQGNPPPPGDCCPDGELTHGTAE